MWSFLPVVENKKRRGGFHIRPDAGSRLAGAYRMRPYDVHFFERSASDAIHRIYYFLFIIYYL